MAGSAFQAGAPLRVAARDFQHLLGVLAHRGYQTIGPTLADGQLIYGEITRAADLPIGWTARQEGGSFRLERRGDQTFFGFAVGQHSFKPWLLPPHPTIWQVQGEGRDWRIIAPVEAPPRFAFLGVRSCELAAMSVQDRVFLGGVHVDPTYRGRREAAFMVAVHCGHHAPGTCFCVSMGSGPRATGGFDLALTEVPADGEHYFLVEIGTQRGAEVIPEVPHRPAQPGEIAAAGAVVTAMAGNMGRRLDTGGLRELLYGNYEHPRWDDVAARCLNCGNCTMVCPTCFCHTLEDSLELTGATAARRRKLDSCFSVDFSYLHGGSIRTSPRSRYRQWLTHKLAAWIDQFGCSGCVGCGRCITWCPVGIDITEEVRAIRETAGAPPKE